MNAAPTAIGMFVKNQRLDLFTSAIESFTCVESNAPSRLETFSNAGFIVVTKTNEIWPEPPFSSFLAKISRFLDVGKIKVRFGKI